MTEVVVKPTVGRRLWFWPGAWDAGDKVLAAMHMNDKITPFDAGVLYVWSDTCVNLQITDHAGGIWFREKVRILLEGEDRNPEEGAGVAEWMPYQVGAKRRELKDSAPPHRAVDLVPDARDPNTINSLIDTALAANEMCRSVYLVAARARMRYGDSDSVANWEALHRALRNSLDAQHGVLRPYFQQRADRMPLGSFHPNPKAVSPTEGDPTPYPLADHTDPALKAPEETNTHETALSETDYRAAMGRKPDLIVPITKGQPCAGPNCGSTNPAFHSHECHAAHNRQIGLSQEKEDGSAVADGINLFYEGEFDNESPEGAAERRYAATRLWGKGWQAGWGEGWIAGYDAPPLPEGDAPPAIPDAPAHKA